MSRIDLPQWKALELYAAKLRQQGLRDVQRKNQNNPHMEVMFETLHADFKNAALSSEGIALLMDLAKACDLEARREALFAGERINNTEGRAVMHMALRGGDDASYRVCGQDVMADVRDVRARFLSFAEDVRGARHTGSTGKAITDVVNIGIGGSDLGPYMVCEALQGHADGPRLHFVSNVDGAHLTDTLRDLNPATTLFVVTSKTFTTQETLLNARSAKNWICAALGADEAVIKQHFAAVSTNQEAVEAFGIDAAHMFPFWDWVGGRFSLWSSVGLSIAISVGAQHFQELLSGATAMDAHFLSAPMAENIPVLAALIGVFYRNFLGCGALAVLPYAQRLHLLPAYLQQLEMESNGKATTKDGYPLRYATCPVLFGQAGTNGQHAFYQMLHQGGDIIPCDFIGFAASDTDQRHHDVLNAHLQAQIEALREGQDYEAALARHDNAELKARHSIFTGGRPSHLYYFDRLTPYNLGMLLALYEHKVFVQGVIWDLNSFDQWGVQLGKDLAQRLAR